MDLKLLREIEKNLTSDRKIALATVIKTLGSSPASLGQEMLVEQDGKIHGTIGGGNTEYLSIQKSLEMMEKGENFKLIDFDLAEFGMVCGGSMTVSIKVMGDEESLIIFGGGHISKSLAKFANGLGMRVMVVEDREELKENFQNSQFIISKADDFEEKVKINPNSFVVICTRGHKHDLEALKYVITKETRYTGMIGSRKKVAELLKSIRKLGVGEEEIKKLYTPIGLDIASEKPQEIAISILAEILLVKNNGNLSHMKDL